ncbi:hypothetical protein Bbelb_072100 [Branchiostoma belcheri]|nr:hypothetical protein Bbelb_072100 [Branchiostoma belcheri]
MATDGSTGIQDAVSSAILGLPTVKSLRDEQYAALESFLTGKDTVALLPTGYGKSLIYQIAPIVAGILASRPNAPAWLVNVKKPIVIVVSPLVALIKDQVEKANSLGISAISLLDAKDKDAEDIKKGRYQLVFGIPELWVDCELWGDMLLSDHFEQNLIGIVVDEVHKTPSWGMAKKGVKAFRQCFGRIAGLRSLCRCGTPLLALTASADAKARKDIVHLLKLKKDATYVEASPNKPNIRLSCVTVKAEDFSCFDWIVRGLREKAMLHPKKDLLE